MRIRVEPICFVPYFQNNKNSSIGEIRLERLTVTRQLSDGDFGVCVATVLRARARAMGEGPPLKLNQFTFFGLYSSALGLLVSNGCLSTVVIIK